MTHIIFDGYIGSDSRFFMANGTDLGYIKFSICSRQRYSHQPDTSTPDIWYDCFLQRRSDTLCQYLTKGKRLLVSGQLQISSYTTRTGEIRPSFTVHVSDFTFLDQRTENDDESTQS